MTPEQTNEALAKANTYLDLANRGIEISKSSLRQAIDALKPRLELVKDDGKN